MADNDKALIDDPGATVSPANRRIEEAMVALHRAVAISQFYPNSNPVMREALERGKRIDNSSIRTPRTAVTED